MNIVICGLMGSGKSHVSRLLEEHYGAPLFSWDTMVSDVYRDPAIIPALVEHFGTSDKTAIANHLFSSDATGSDTVVIDFLITPAAMGKLSKALSLPESIVEIPVLGSSFFQFSIPVDKRVIILNVEAPDSVRRERVIARDSHQTIQTVQAKMQAQAAWRQGQRDISHYTMVNDGGDLRTQLEGFYAYVTSQLSKESSGVGIIRPDPSGT